MTTIISTIGAANANCYQPIDDITAFLTLRYGNAIAWLLRLTPEQREQIAIRATELLDLQTWVGIVADTDQSLQLPRSGVYDRNGSLYADDVIPAPVLAAHAELCDYLANQRDAMRDIGAEFVDSIPQGDTTVTLKPRSADQLPAQVMRHLRGLIGSNSAQGRAERA